MWLVGEFGVGTMLGDEVFERVHNEVGVDAQYASPSCPSLVEAVGNQSIIKISTMRFSLAIGGHTGTAGAVGCRWASIG